MLTENFIASISAPTNANTNASSTATAKDAAIFLYELQPSSGPRSLFKKSATLQNGLAVSESHVFAAQEGKAVVHVYNREKGSQEATVPFLERICSVSSACDDTVLVVGTEGGRVILWESHLQPITSLAVDPPSSFLLSGSEDGSIHVWSLPDLLSFSSSTSFPTSTDDGGQRAPRHTLSTHHGAITALAVGHGYGAANIAVSASKDKSCIIWDYQNGSLLSTYLMSETPLCLALDPADRAFWTGYEDGSIQFVDLYSSQNRGQNGGIGRVNMLYVEETATTPIQPLPNTRWHHSSSVDLGATLSIDTSYDRSILLTGHTSGNIGSWDVARGKFDKLIASTPLPGPVTNLKFLPVEDFPLTSAFRSSTRKSNITMQSVVKPQYAAFGINEGREDVVPGNYAVTAQPSTQLPATHFSAAGADGEESAFEAALIHSTFPSSMLEAGIAELADWTATPRTESNPISAASAKAPSAGAAAAEEDFMALDAPEVAAQAQPGPQQPTLSEQNQDLQRRVSSLQSVVKVSFKQLEELRREAKEWKRERLEMQKARYAKAERGWARLGVNGLPASEDEGESGSGSESQVSGSEEEEDEAEEDDAESGED
ncbi:Pre-rRNA-processing protein ipi3 [Elasticomyces elasticus]|nr:Pre-rRNA-processing protein ipi3 [Elasticomyces elasticus]